MKKQFLLLLVFLLVPFVRSIANDSASEFAAGGIVLKQEPRISIEKEDLFISQNKVKVAYIFKNNSNNDITVDVAFPIPLYESVPDTIVPSFPDFLVTVDGKTIPVQFETKAFSNGKDITATLQSIRKEHLDTFFDFDVSHEQGFDPPLPENSLKKLKALHLLDNGVPTWKISKTYFWRQTFPAHKELRVTHEYSPYQGYELNSLADAKKKYVGHSCLSSAQLDEVYSKLPLNDQLLRFRWVDYILTTANNWQKPIKKFHLTATSQGIDGWTALCADIDHKVIQGKKIEFDQSNFIPKSEIRIYFISTQ